MNYRLQEIIETEKGRLYFRIEKGDRCYYLGEYTSHKSYDYSEINQLISNLKKKPSSKKSVLKHKRAAIKKIGEIIALNFNPKDLKSITLIPIPPSKVKEDDKYDDRMLKICEEIKKHASEIEIADIITCCENQTPSHNSSDNRLQPKEIYDNYKIICANDYKPRANIFIIDDVLVAGTHFKACQRKLINHFKGYKLSIIGIFVAKRVFASPAEGCKSVITTSC